MLSHKLLEQAFELLSKNLAESGIKGEIGVVGGAAMVLAYHAREATRDVDAVFAPSASLREAAAKVAEELHLPADWLNDGVKGFMPDGQPVKNVLIKMSNLLVWTPEPAYLLAMKATSARLDSKDASDLKFLIKHCEIKTAEEVFELISKYYPKGKILAKVQYFVEELFEAPTE
jgi:hypothetical protein